MTSVAESNPLPPLAILRDLERRALAAASALPEVAGQLRHWRGIGFRVGEIRLVVEMGDVREVLHLPRVARVPGTKVWMRGLASLRGELLPVADLGQFLSGHPDPVTRDSRALVIQEAGLMVGLQVEEVFGLQQFANDSFTEQTGQTPAWLAPYLVGCFTRADERWLVFDVRALLRAGEFLQAAA